MFLIRDVAGGFRVLDHFGNECEEDKVHQDNQDNGGQEERVEGDTLRSDEAHGVR